MWFQPEAPLGSAVRYMASLCAFARGVEFRGGRGKAALGDCRGTPAMVLAAAGGEFRIHLHPDFDLSPGERTGVLRVAGELGGLWPRRR